MELNRISAIDFLRGISLIGLLFFIHLDSTTQFKYLNLFSNETYRIGDLLLPFLVFTTGVSMNFSYSKLRLATSKRSHLHQTIALRSLRLGLGGLFLSILFFQSHLSLFAGGLITWAIAYYIGGIIHLFIHRISDKIIVSISCLIVYSLTLSLFPLIHIQLANQVHLPSISDLLAQTALLSWLASQVPIYVAIMIVGQLVGDLFFAKPYSQIRFWTGLLLGLVSVWIGTIASLTLDSIYLHSLIFTLISSGWAIMAFCISYLFIEIYKFNRLNWIRPVIYLGRNSILFFFITLLLANTINQAQWPHHLGYSAQSTSIGIGLVMLVFYGFFSRFLIKKGWLLKL